MTTGITVPPALGPSKMLKKDENVYETFPGCWVAEFILHDGNWTRLGVFGSREWAVKKLIDSRNPRAI